MEKVNRKKWLAWGFVIVLIKSSPAMAIPDRKPTLDYPAVGSLYQRQSSKHELATQGCTVTLIHSQWVVTAAHCVLNRATGEPKSDLVIFFLDFGFADVIDEIVHESFEEGRNPPLAAPPKNDIALLKLALPVTTVEPIAYTKFPLEPSKGMLVSFSPSDRIKRDGVLELSECSKTRRSDIYCWIIGKNSVRGRDGDSGGALITFDAENKPILTGVFVFGSAGDRVGVPRPGSESWSTSIAAHAVWITEHIPSKKQAMLKTSVLVSGFENQAAIVIDESKAASIIVTALADHNACSKVILEAVRRDGDGKVKTEVCNANSKGSADACRISPAPILVNIAADGLNCDDTFVQWKIIGIP